jgi:hypothetical protein
MKEGTQKSSKAQTIAIIHGFCEGPWHEQRLRPALEAAGFVITADPHNADIILAHSGGCFLVPPPRAGQRVIFIGIPYWPGRSLAYGLMQKMWRDLLLHYTEKELRFWAVKTLQNGRYLWQAKTHLNMLRGRRRRTVWQHGANAIVIRHTEDTVCTPELASLPFTNAPRSVELPGHHDDCWRIPAAIVDVVQSNHGA